MPKVLPATPNITTPCHHLVSELVRDVNQIGFEIVNLSIQLKSLGEPYSKLALQLIDLGNKWIFQSEKANLKSTWVELGANFIKVGKGWLELVRSFDDFHSAVGKLGLFMSKFPFIPPNQKKVILQF